MGKVSATAILGVIYPGAEVFLDDYLASLEGQTCIDFDLIIVNNQFSGFDRYREKYHLNITEIKSDAAPVKVREQGINYAKSAGYEYLIFADADDLYSENRVEKSLQLLDSYDVVANDLSLMGPNGDVYDPLYFSNRIENLFEPGFDFILDKNIFGLANTAIRLDSLAAGLVFNDAHIAVDWYFFASLLKDGFRAVFTNEAVTYYRIYENNVIGLGKEVNEQRTRLGIDVKLVFYQELLKNDKNMASYCEKISSVKKSVTSSCINLDTYMNNLKALNIHKPFWWEEIRLPDDTEL